MNGIINVLKPPGMSSHDVVYAIRRKTKIKKVGHTGTLDPNAAGVLPICIGQATKISNYLLEDKKAYRGELALGITTDTQDMYGTILESKPVNFNEVAIKEAVLSFIGKYDQTPPMYSALKVKGKKLYDYAREGIEIERQSRSVEIFDIKIIYIKENKVLFDVICSKGTYIRTLCHDIGKKLGCGGVMSFLIRTKSSVFTIAEAISIEELQEHENIEEILKPMDYPLNHMPKVEIDESQKRLALNGNKIDSKYFINPAVLTVDSLVTVYMEGNFIGLANIKCDNNTTYIKFTRLLI